MTLHNTSIKRKVMAVIMRTSLAVLLLTVVAFMVYDMVTFRQSMVRNLTTEARLIAENSAGALAFQNEADATNVLASLRNEPSIVAAAIYDAQGRLFVKYPADLASAALPAPPAQAGYQFGQSTLTLSVPIEQTGTELGTLCLRSDLTGLWQRLQLYGAISVMIMLCSLLVALWLSNTLQSRISDPIIALAEIARNISGHHDYSLRAAKVSDDELGLLTDSFNTMLDRIQASDSALRASEAQFRLVTDQAPVLLAHLDRQLRYKFVNQPYAAHFGRKPQELIGQPAAGIVGEALFARMGPYAENALLGRPVQFEMEISPAGQEPRWSHVVFTPEKSALGEVVGLVAVHTDITQRKHNELEIERACDQAVKASRAKDDFLAALSHELRTPLNPVLLVASDEAVNPGLPAETRAAFEMIRRNVELEARLIDDLLDLTRITRGKLSLDLQPLDLLPVLQDAIDTVRPEAEQKRISFAIDLRVEAHQIAGDAVRLRQIFWNVLKNAVKFTPAGGRITVEARNSEPADHVVIKVIDTGIGLTAGEISHVFDAFSQGDHAGSAGSHQFGGLGLGLAISRRLVELHSGMIQAVSAGRHHGATFIMEFPLYGAEAALVKVESPAGLPANEERGGLKRKAGIRILLVEDHEATRTVLAHFLAQRKYQVLSAGSVAEARLLVGRQHFDLVVSDIGLPDGSGYDLMLELRDTYGLRGIALTGYGMDQDVVRSKNSGFVMHLTKPVSVDSLDKALLGVI